eukprot:g12906.t1
MATVSADGCFYLWDLQSILLEPHKDFLLAEYFLEPHKDFRGGETGDVVAIRQLAAFATRQRASRNSDPLQRRRWEQKWHLADTAEALGKTYARLYDLYHVSGFEQADVLGESGGSGVKRELPDVLALHTKLELPAESAGTISSLAFDRTLQQISRDEQRDTAWLMQSREYGPGTDVSVRYGGSTLYATTSLGTLWAFPHPVKPSSQYQEYFLHAVRRKTTRTQGPTLVQMLCNENRLITAGLDGSIFLLSLASGAGRAATGGAGGGGGAAATQQLRRGADGGGEKDSRVHSPLVKNLPKTDEICLVEKQELVSYADQIATEGKNLLYWGCLWAWNSYSCGQNAAFQKKTPEKLEHKVKQIKVDRRCLVCEIPLQKCRFSLASNPEKLEHEVKQIKLDSLQKLDQQRYMYEARLESSKAVNDKTETEQLKERIALLEDIIQEREQEPARMVKALEAQHIAAQEQLESMYAAKLQMENDRYSIFYPKNFHEKCQLL